MGPKEDSVANVLALAGLMGRSGFRIVALWR